MLDILGLLIVVVLLLVFGYLTSRAWRARNALVKWPGLVLAGLLTLILTAALVLALIGFVKLNTPQPNPVSSLKGAVAPDQGAYATQKANACNCHTTTGKTPLDGGNDNFLPSPLGVIIPPNLTPAGPLKDWTDGEIIRAVREGVHKNGRPLLIMPSDILHNLSDSDTQALVAFLRSQPPVQHDLPDNSLTVLGAALVGVGIFPTNAQPPITQPVVAPPRGTSPEYGKYLVNIFGCRLCHGADLTGGTPGGFTPVGPNLTLIVPNWNEAGFVKMFRTGVDPTGYKVADTMPWENLGDANTDDDLKAIYQYLKGLPPTQKPAK